MGYETHIPCAQLPMLPRRKAFGRWPMKGRIRISLQEKPPSGRKDRGGAKRLSTLIELYLLTAWQLDRI